MFAKGGEGGVELAKEVVRLATEEKADFKLLYGEELSLKEKIETIAQKIYGKKLKPLRKKFTALRM